MKREKIRNNKTEKSTINKTGLIFKNWLRKYF